MHALTIAAGVAVAMGGEAQRPDWWTIRSDFDALLAAEPGAEEGDGSPSDRSPRGIKLRALGIGR